MRMSAFSFRRLGTLVLTVAAGLLAATASAQAVDPPGFAPLTLKGTQVIRLNVLCFDHEVGSMLPAACRGEVMFHDAAGREIKSGRYELEPGQTMFLQLAVPALNAAGDPIRRVLIIPCVVPDPGGVAVPTVEVFDRDAGRSIVFANPAAARMSDFSKPRYAGRLRPAARPAGIRPGDRTIRPEHAHERVLLRARPQRLRAAGLHGHGHVP
jgi:hypothetical protein